MPLFFRLPVPGHPHPCRGAEACSHGPDCSLDQEFPQLLLMVIDVPVMQVLLLPQVVHIPVVAQRQFPTVLRTMEIPQFFFNKVFNVPVRRW